MCCCVCITDQRASARAKPGTCLDGTGVNGFGAKRARAPPGHVRDVRSDAVYVLEHRASANGGADAGQADGLPTALPDRGRICPGTSQLRQIRGSAARVPINGEADAPLLSAALCANPSVFPLAR